MLWNDDNGKENTGGLTCETLCEQEYKPCGCFAIINQHFNMGVNENQIIYFRVMALNLTELLAWNLFFLFCKNKMKSCQDEYGEARADSGLVMIKFTNCLLSAHSGYWHRNTID